MQDKVHNNEEAENQPPQCADVEPTPVIAKKFTQGRRSDTAVRILDAAERIYADYGYEGTSLRQIAEVVGIKEPSLYKHFAGKDAIYNAVVERTVRPLIELMEDSLNRDKSLTEIMQVPEEMVQILAQHPHGVRLLQRELSISGTGMNPIAKQWFGKLREGTRQFGVVIRGEDSLESDANVQHRTLDDLPKRSPEDSLLVFLALLNVSMGYFGCVPFMEAFGGQDLLSENMIKKQSKLFGDMFRNLLIQS